MTALILQPLTLYLPSVTNIQFHLACIASVSVWLQSEEQGMRVTDQVKNGVSKRVGGGGGKGDAPPPPPFNFLDLVPFLAWPKLKIRFLGLSLLRKQNGNAC